MTCPTSWNKSGANVERSVTYLYFPDEGSLLPKYRDCTTSNDFESYIYIYIYIYISIYSSVLPLRSVGRSNFDKGRHNLTTLIHKTDLH